ncbi:MAG: SURF1 family cytochrome oxidase biogenesis protein, partial [Ahrensia sp.]
MNSPATKRTIKPWIVIAAAVPVLAVLLTLGTWQVNRLAWKEDLLAKIDAQLDAAPIDVMTLSVQLDDGALDQQAIDYLPAQATGNFNHAGEQHFFATYKGISGYFIYTPLELIEPQGTVLFVNRGFVPFDLKEAETRKPTLVPGIANIRGLARQRLDAKPSVIVPENDLAKNIYYWKDLAAMAAQAGYQADATVLPFFLDAGFPDRPGTLGQWPVDGVTRIDLPNNHLQYAI